MKLTGGFLVLGASLASTYLNFKLMKEINMAGEFDFMWKSASKTTRALGGLGLVIGGLTLAMQSNFMGVRDSVTNSFKTFKEAWSNSKTVVEQVYAPLDSLEKRFDSLTLKFAKIRLVFMSLGKTLFGKTDGNGGILYTAKEIENLRKFGLLPMAQTFAILKGRAISFIKGLKDGIGSAIVVLKNFANMVLTPIKEVLKAIGVKLEPLKKMTGFGLNGDNGMDSSKAQEQSKMFQDIGKKAGILLGTLLGFKVIKTLSPIITSPFKLLSKSVKNSVTSVKELKDSMKSGFGNIKAPFVSFGNAFKTNKTKAGNRINSFIDEYQELPISKSTFGSKYSKVSQMPSRYHNFVAPNTNGSFDSDNVYVKNRS